MPAIWSTRILISLIILNFVMFFFFLTVPYYYLLGAEHYIPKANPAWGFMMPNSPEAWLFFILAFIFLAFWGITVMLLIWKRPDIAQRGWHPTY